MVRNKGKRTIITAVAVLTGLLLVIGVIAFMQMRGNSEPDPYALQNTNDTPSVETDDNKAQDAANQDIAKPESTTETYAAEEEAALDPATVGAIAIPPMSITVSYVKGVGGFEYEVLRTTNGTRYVEFRSGELAGTKCTNDTGAFASILAEPASNEATTLTKTTVVDGTTYGLALEGTTCTGDVEKLKSYQQSFSDAFSLLKKSD